MPAGVPWSRYLPFLGASLLSMIAGAQVVHSYYRPLEDLETLIQIEVEKQKLLENNKVEHSNDT